MAESNPTNVLQRLRKARRSSPFFFFHALREHGWILLLTILLVMLPVAGYVWIQEPTYISGITFQMEVTDPSSGAMAAPSTGWSMLPRLQSADFIRDTLAKSESVSRLAKASGFNGSAADLDGLAKHLATMMIAKVDGSTGRVQLLMETKDPEAVEDFYTSLARNFAEIASVAQRDSKLERLKLLEKTIEESRIESEEAAAKLKTYLKQVQILDPDGSGQMVNKVDYLNKQVKETTGEVAQWKLDYEKVAALRGKPDELLGLPEISNHSTIVGIKRQIEAQKKIVERLEEASQTQEVAELVTAKVRLEDMNKILADAALQFPDLLQAEWQKSEFLKKQAEDRLKKQMELEEKLKADGWGLQSLESRANATRNRYEAFLRTEVDAEAAKEDIRPKPLPIEPVVVPRLTVSTDTKALLSAGLGFGTLLGLLFMLARHNSNQKIRTVHEAEKALNVQVLGIIPLEKSLAGLSAEQLRQDRKDSAVTEAFRSLRAYISVITQDSPRRIFLVSSANAGEGKTSAAAHFAASQAQSGKRTLLVDCDLRRPDLTRNMMKTDKTTGLTDYAIGVDSLENLIVEILPNLFFLPAGRRIPNPGELLSNPWVGEFFNEALEKFEVVVMDSAPINAVGDTVFLLPYTEGVFLVVNSKETSAPAVTKALQTIQAANVAPLGVVLNRMPKGSVVAYGDKITG